MLKESYEHQQHVRFSPKRAERGEHATFSAHRILSANSLKLNFTKLSVVVIHSSKQALHHSPLTFRSEQTSLEPFITGRIIVLRAITRIVRVFTYICNCWRTWSPFQSLYIYYLCFRHPWYSSGRNLLPALLTKCTLQTRDALLIGIGVRKRGGGHGPPSNSLGGPGPPKIGSSILLTHCVKLAVAQAT